MRNMEIVSTDTHTFVIIANVHDALVRESEKHAHLTYRWPFLVVWLLAPLFFIGGIVGWHLLLGLVLTHSVIWR